MPFLSDYKECSGWLDRRDKVSACLREFWTYRDELMAQDTILYKGIEVMVPSSIRRQIPDAPWSKVAQDMFSSSGETYLVTVDYYSDYYELDLLEETTAAAVINA